MRPVRRPLALALLVLAATLLACPPAGARPDRVRTVSTRIFVSEKYPAFHGALRSHSAYCYARRRLLVYRARRGPDKLVARGWSHRSGAWKVSLGEKLGRGHYYVVAPRRGSGSFGIRCRLARSKSIPVVETDAPR